MRAIYSSLVLITGIGAGLFFSIPGQAQPIPGQANATNFAVSGTMFFYPENPKACEKVEVEYLNGDGVPTNTVGLNLSVTAQFIDRTSSNYVFAMKAQDSPLLWTNEFYLTRGVTQLIVSVVTDKELVDNNKGSNWAIRVVACESQFIRPDEPVTTDPLTIFLLPSISPLSTATSITAFATYSTGDEQSYLMQVDINNGLWSATIDKLPRFATSVSVVFAVTGGDPVNTDNPLVVALIVPPLPVKGDFDGDGFGDVLIQHTDTGYVAFLGMQSNRVVEAGYAGGGFSVSPLRLIGSSDLNRDGREDVVWRNADTDMYVWSLLDGTNVLGVGQFFDESTLRDWEIIAVADFNGDEYGDLLVQHKTYKIWAVVHLEDLALVDVVFVNGSMDYAAWRVVGAGDVDGDGFPDVVLEQSQTGQTGILWMEDHVPLAFSPIHGAESESLWPWRIVGLSDVDGSNRVEFILQLGKTAYYEIYYTQLVGDQWIFDSEPLGGFTTGLGNWRVIGPR